MVDTPAFQAEVIAYLAIVVIGREKLGETHVAIRPPIESPALMAIAKAMTSLTSMIISPVKQRRSVPSVHIACIIVASFRATVTWAFFRPARCIIRGPRCRRHGFIKKTQKTSTAILISRGGG